MGEMRNTSKILFSKPEVRGHFVETLYVGG